MATSPLGIRTNEAGTVWMQVSVGNKGLVVSWDEYVWESELPDGTHPAQITLGFFSWLKQEYGLEFTLAPPPQS